MPSDDYAAVTKGGLRLKGVAGGKVEKNKKKKKRPKDGVASEGDEFSKEKIESQGNSERNHDGLKDSLADHEDQLAEGESAEASIETGNRKTEAEKRHEELKRKRLDERLKREGVKTHKERVEELNRYLSSLSEHHDMPRIGPG